MNEKIKQNLKELGLSSNEVKVYLAITQLGESVASKIAKKAELPRTTTISILGKLVLGGYLSSHRYLGSNYYEVESPKVLQNIFANKLTVATDLEKFLRNMYRSEAIFPFANVYDTKQGIRVFIENLLANLERKSFILTIDSPHQGNYDKVLSENYGKILLETKKKKDILTKTLIPHRSFSIIDDNKIKNQNIKIKEMPIDIDFKSSVWFVNNLLVLFSANPTFIVAIHHSAIVESMKSLYNYIWNISTSVN